MKTFSKLKFGTAFCKYGIGVGFHPIAYCIGDRDCHAVNVPGGWWYSGAALDQEGNWK